MKSIRKKFTKFFQIGLKSIYNPMKRKKTSRKPQNWLGNLWRISKRCLSRYSEDNVTMISNGMVYATLIALVPCLAFVYSFISYLGFTDPVVRIVNQFLLETFGDDNGQILITYLDKFLSNAMGLGIISMLSFFVTFLLLIDNLHVTVNRFFHCSNKKNMPVRVGKYAISMIVSMASIALLVTVYTRFIASYIAFDGGLVISGYEEVSRVLISRTMVFITIFMINYVLPDCRVSRVSAFWGSLFGSVLIFLLEFVFKLVVKFSVSKFVIYGSLAAVLFFFMFISWAWRIIFTSVVVTKVLDENRETQMAIRAEL